MAEQQKGGRPRFVTILALAVFSLSVINLAGLLNGLSRYQLYASLDLALPAWFLVLMSGLWGAAFLALAIGLWALLPRIPKITIIVLASFLLYEVLFPLIFARASYEYGRIPFHIASSLLVMAVVILGLTRPRVRQAFENRTRRQIDESRPQDPAPP